MALAQPLRPDVLQLLELTEEGANQSLDVYLIRTLDLCANWFQASGASLFLRELGEVYGLAASAGVDTTVPKDAKIRTGEGIAGAAIQQGEAFLLQDRIEKVHTAKSSEIGSSMIIPLQTRQWGAVGVLCLSRRKGERLFSNQDLSAVKALASHIALAVSNAKLFAESLTVQRQLEEAKRLAEIGQMTAAIAHEIRNPLTGIRAAAQMVGEESKELGEIIVEETDKLDRLCGEFLDFAKPFELHKEPLELGSLAARVVELEVGEFKSAGVQLLLEIEPNLPNIYLDARRIEQVCRNLIRNSLQACKQGELVIVRVGSGGIEIRDTGGGMSAEQLAKLFTPFFTTKPQGTGLGMCIVKKIVDAHRGEIEVSSKPGEGTSIRVRFWGEN